MGIQPIYIYPIYNDPYINCITYIYPPVFFLMTPETRHAQPQLSRQVAPSPSTLYKDPLADCTINLRIFVNFRRKTAGISHHFFFKHAFLLVPKNKDTHI